MNKLSNTPVIKYNLRSYDSRINNNTQGIFKRASKALWNGLEYMTGYNDQLCLTKLNERGTEIVTSTGITQEMLEKFSKNESSQKDYLRVKRFLQKATDHDLTDFNKKKLQKIAKLIAKSSDKLDSIKLLLQSPKVNELLPAFSDNPGLFIGLDSVLLNKIISLQDSFIIKKLGEYPLWKLNRDLLKGILDMTMPEIVKILTNLNFVPNLLGMKFSFVSNIFASPQFLALLDLLNNYPYLLNHEKMLDLWDKIFASPRYGFILEILGQHPNLLDHKKITPELWDKILASSEPDYILKTLFEILKETDSYSYISFTGNVMDNISTELWDKILASSQPASVLSIVGNNPYLLQLEQLAPELWGKILASSEPDDVILILGRYPKLLENEKITPELWDKILSSPSAGAVLRRVSSLRDLFNEPEFVEKLLLAKNLLHTLEWAYWEKYITISAQGYSYPNSHQPTVYLNLDLFFDDSTIDQWNILPQEEGFIDDDSWAMVQTRLADIFDSIYQERDNQRERLFRFLEQCMETADAKKPKGKQIIRKRVDAIVTILEQYLVKTNSPDLSKEKNEAIRKRLIGHTLDLMAMGGSACPDNAIVLLRQAENNIQLFENPQYLPNIIVNMFKLDAISKNLIDPNNSENVETYLSYTLKLSGLLGLGISGAMLFEEHYGKTEPFEEALPKLCTAFTEKELIKFTTSLEEFQARFANAKENALKAKEEEYMDTYDLEDEKQAALARENIANGLEDIKDSFYSNTAKQLFLDSGFFTTINPTQIGDII